MDEQKSYHELMFLAVKDILDGFNEQDGSKVNGLKKIIDEEKDRRQKQKLRDYCEQLEQASTPQDIYKLLNNPPNLTYVVQKYLTGDSPLAKKAGITRRDYENSEFAKQRQKREEIENLPNPDENLAYVVNHLLERIAEHDEVKDQKDYVLNKKKDTCTAHDARNLLRTLKRKLPDYSSHHGELTLLQQLLDKPKQNNPSQLEHIYQLPRDARPVYLMQVDEYVNMIENGKAVDLKLIPQLASLIGNAGATLDQVQQELRDIQSKYGNLKKMGKTLNDLLEIVEGETKSSEAMKKLKQKIESTRDELNTLFPILGKTAQPQTNYPLSDIAAYLPLITAAATALLAEKTAADNEVARLNSAAQIIAGQHADELLKLNTAKDAETLRANTAEAERDQKEAARAALETEKLSLEGRVNALTGEIATKDATIASQTAELARKADYDTITQELAQLRTRYQTLEQEKTAAEQAKAQLETDNAGLLTLINEANKKKTDYADELAKERAKPKVI